MSEQLGTINLNRRVKIQLNARGLEIYNKFHEDLGIKAPMLIDNTIIMELWDVAHVFGKHFGNGFPPVFESNDLVIFD